MAPRKGGSSSYYGFGSIDNKCSDSYFFLDSYSQPYTISELTISGVFLVLFSLLFMTFFVRWRMRRHTTKIAAWWSFGIALIFIVVAFILRVVIDALYYCTVAEPNTYSYSWTAIDILYYGLANLILLAIFMIPLLAALLRCANLQAKIAYIVQSIFFGIILIFWIADRSVYYSNLYPIYPDGFPEDSKESLRKADNGLQGTYRVLFLVAVVTTSVGMAFALFRSWRNTAVSTSLKVWLPITIAAFLGTACLSLAESFDWFIIHQHLWEKDAYIASNVLDSLFTFVSALGLLFCASSRGFAELFPLTASNKPAMSYYPPPAPYAAAPAAYGQAPEVTHYGMPQHQQQPVLQTQQPQPQQQYSAQGYQYQPGVNGVSSSPVLQQPASGPVHF